MTDSQSIPVSGEQHERRLRGPARLSRLSQRSSERTPINVHPDVVMALRDLLFEDDMRGVGYSEFIARAVAQARAEREDG